MKVLAKFVQPDDQVNWSLSLQNLPIGIYNDIWFWLYHNNIGDMVKKADQTGGYVNEVLMSDEEATMFRLRWL